jgi:hypothetical protein
MSLSTLPNLEMFSMFQELDQIFFLSTTSHTPIKRWNFGLDQWVVKDMSDGFKVVATGYCDESIICIN